MKVTITCELPVSEADRASINNYVRYKLGPEARVTWS